MMNTNVVKKRYQTDCFLSILFLSSVLQYFILILSIKGRTLYCIPSRCGPSTNIHLYRTFYKPDGRFLQSNVLLIHLLIYFHLKLTLKNVFTYFTLPDTDWSLDRYDNTKRRVFENEFCVHAFELSWFNWTLRWVLEFEIVSHLI